MKDLIRRETSDGKELVRFMLEVFQGEKYPVKNRLEAARWLAEIAFSPTKPRPHARGRKPGAKRGRRHAHRRKSSRRHCCGCRARVRLARRVAGTARPLCGSPIVMRRELYRMYASRYTRSASSPSGTRHPARTCCHSAGRWHR